VSTIVVIPTVTPLVEDELVSGVVPAVVSTDEVFWVVVVGDDVAVIELAGDESEAELDEESAAALVLAAVPSSAHPPASTIPTKVNGSRRNIGQRYQRECAGTNGREGPQELRLALTGAAMGRS
jgi:hypothetical protein